MLSKEPSWLQMIFGGTALMSAAAQLQAALTYPTVAGILLQVSSPGGSVLGVDDFAQAVREANKVKPVYAYIEDLGASSAYWAICGARSIWINPSGFASGSGCYQVVGRQLEGSGAARPQLRSHLVRRREGQGEPGVAVTDEYREEIQRRISDITGRFVEAVAWRMPIAKARELMDGRLWMGEQAREMGLVDQVGTIQGARRALRKEAKSMSEAKASATELETTKASLITVTQERDTLAARVAELEKKLAPPRWTVCSARPQRRVRYRSRSVPATTTTPARARTTKHASSRV
jgi:ClpP class serine protease